MLGALVLGATAALAQEACAPVDPVPDTLQVAWVSRANDRVGALGEMTVVRSAALQELVAARGRDATAVLHALGLLAPRREAEDGWKIVLFDVPREALCRPTEGDTVGVPRCDDAARLGVHPKAWTGCGYLQDVVSGERTLDVFHVEWAEATSQGFCLLPLPRFLAGRP
jgi:hypothetical protein